MSTGCRVTTNFFDTLGVKPALGRAFPAEDGQPGKDRDAILSYGLWRSRFAADPNIVGKTIQLQGDTYTVTGVMPKFFEFPMAAKIWVPLAMDSAERQARGQHYLEVVGRLKPGVHAAQARVEIQTIARRLEAAYPLTNTGWGARVLTVREFVSGDLTRQYTLMLLVASLFLLLIAAANVANLQYARAAEREREVVLRMALGAGAWRIIRQLLTESIVLGLAGAALGLVLARLGLIEVLRNMPSEIARYIAGWDQIGLDRRALSFTIAVAVLAGVVSGFAPAIRISRSSLNETLKEGGRGGGLGKAQQRTRGFLVVFEVAMALILLIGSGLMVSGFKTLLAANQGLAPASVLTARLVLPQAKYKDDHLRVAFYDRALAEIGSIPGVQSVAAATTVPYGDGGAFRNLSIEGHPTPSAAEEFETRLQVVSPNYFQMMRVAMRQGREFTDSDGAGSVPVAIVGETFARRYWPGQNPLGRHVRIGGPQSTEPWLTVVGVANDVRYFWTSRDPEPVLYRPYRQASLMRSYFAIRTSGDPVDLASAIRSKIAGVDPEQPVFEIYTLQRVITNSIVGLAYVAAMMAVLGLIALALSSVGVYGVLAYAVTERTHEIGVRMALGARRGAVMAMVMTRGAILTLAGLAIGLPVSILLARLLSRLIFGIGATDLATFGGVTAALMAVALAACFIPAHRATRVDPMVALRYE